MKLGGSRADWKKSSSSLVWNHCQASSAFCFRSSSSVKFITSICTEPLSRSFWNATPMSAARLTMPTEPRAPSSASRVS
ncbi:hypothetical protein D9M68_929280 [compost metagenome]